MPSNIRRPQSRRNHAPTPNGCPFAPCHAGRFIVVFTLALAIGANTAIFSVVNSLLLGRCRCRKPGRLVTVSSDFALATASRRARAGTTRCGRGCSRCRRSSTARSCGRSQRSTWRAAERRSRRGTLLVSGSFFSTLGVQPRVGRLLTIEDDVRGGGKDGPVVVISHRLWRERFGGSPPTRSARA